MRRRKGQRNLAKEQMIATKALHSHHKNAAKSRIGRLEASFLVTSSSF